MTIAFNCPGCGADLKAPDDCAGGKARCKTCETPVQIPNSESPRSANRTHVQPNLQPANTRTEGPPIQRTRTGRGAKLTALICIAMAICAVAVIAKLVVQRSNSEKTVAIRTADVGDGEPHNEIPPDEITTSTVSRGVGNQTKPDLGSLVASQVEISEQWDDCFDSFGTGIDRFRLSDGEDLLSKSRTVEKMAQGLKGGEVGSSDTLDDYHRAARNQTRAIELMQKAVDENLSADDAAETATAAFGMWEDSQKRIGSWAFSLRTQAAGNGNQLPYTRQLVQLEHACTLKQFQDKTADPIVSDLKRYGGLVKDVMILRAEIAGKLEAALQLDSVSAQLNALDGEVIPVHRRLMVLLVGYTPVTPEVEELHGIIVAAEELNMQGTQLLADSLRRTDESQLEESIAMGLMAKRQYNEWQAKFAELVRMVKTGRQRPSNDAKSSRRPTSPRELPQGSLQNETMVALNNAWTKCSAVGYSRSEFRAQVESMRDSLTKSSATSARQIAEGACNSTAAVNPGWSAEACLECYEAIIDYLTE